MRKKGVIYIDCIEKKSLKREQQATYGFIFCQPKGLPPIFTSLTLTAWPLLTQEGNLCLQNRQRTLSGPTGRNGKKQTQKNLLFCNISEENTDLPPPT